MIVAGFIRPESTIRARSWPSDDRAAGSLEIGREIALEALLRERPAVTEEAQADLAVGDDRAAARGIALGAGERLRQRILSMRDAHHREGRDDRGREPHPNTSPVMVRNQASASTASAARVARGASAGLTPPEPGTSARSPLADGW